MAGCFCIPGYVRIDGKCVTLRPCPQECPPNSSWQLGSSCSELNYYYGCFCDKGFIRFKGECVSNEECTVEECPGGKEWNECGNLCSQACPNDGIVCSQKCWPGCFCPEGLVEIDGKCVKKECKCKENQVYRWGNDCADQCGTESQICDDPWREDCFCAEGFRNFNGECVPLEKCPNDCPEGMTFDYEGDICDNYCPGTVRSCLKETGEYTAACYCKEKELIPVNGVCVKRDGYCDQVAISIVDRIYCNNATFNAEVV